MGETIAEFDRLITLQVASWFGESGLREVLPWLGNLYFWSPVAIFFVLLLVLNFPKGGATNLLFVIGSFVLSFQAAQILAALFRVVPPYYLPSNGLSDLPAASTLYHVYCLPDWQIAALAGIHFFVAGRAREQKLGIPLYSGIYVWLFAFCRFAAGYTYLIGMYLGLLVGYLMAMACRHLVRKLDFLMAEEYPGPKKTTGQGQD